MNPSGGYWSGNDWAARRPSSRSFVPAAGPFSAISANISGPPARPQQTVHPTANQDFSSQGPFQTLQYLFPSGFFQPAQLPFSNASYNEHRNFVTAGPIVHEGYIPAPGQEDEDDTTYPALSSAFRESAFFNGGLQGSSDEDSEDEGIFALEEEQILHEAAEKNDLEADRDFSISEEELEEDPDEMLLDESDEEVEVRPRRGRHKGRGTRGGRRGRPSARTRGGLRGTISTRGRQTGRLGRPKGRHGPRAAADPGAQFKDFQRLANEAYMRRDFPLAIQYAEKAIQLNPEIFVAHNMLSEIYAAMEEEHKSVQALLVGAPTKRDKDLWWLIIERVEKIDPRKHHSYTRNRKTQIILNCLTSIIMLDPMDWEARSRKLEIEVELGRISKCVKQIRKMLTIKPHDYNLLRQMAILGTSTPKYTRLHLSKIIESYEVSIAHYMAHDQDPASSTLDWAMLNIYLDLLDLAGDCDRALSRLKTLARWKQNRAEETYWDNEKDDREFDLADAPRRTAVPGFRRGSSPILPGKALPMEFRVKLGLFRVKQKPCNYSEAMYHLNMLDPANENTGAPYWDYPDLFRVVADTLHATGHDEDALRFYKPLYTYDREQLGLRSFLGLYTCCRNLGDDERAEEIIYILEDWEADMLDDLTILAKFFEDIGMQEEAMRRAESVYRNGGKNAGLGRLRKIGFKGYDELVQFFFQQRKRARGKHSARKKRTMKYVKKLKAATRPEEHSEDEDAVLKLPSLGPLNDRPTEGLFRSKKDLLTTKPTTFLPVQPETFEGTNIPINAIDRKFFQRRLETLASQCADEIRRVRSQHREIVASFQRLDQLSEGADNGDQAASSEFVSIARELIEEFSTFALFYEDRRETFKGYFRTLGSGEIWRDAAVMALAVEANRAEDGEKEPGVTTKFDAAPQEFYGVHFDRWADAFGRYAFILARQGESDRCFSALDVAVQANIFRKSQTYYHLLELCRLACALAVDDSVQASAAIRCLMRMYPFSTELFRMYSIANRLCSPSESYASSPTVKALKRYVKTMDYVLLTPEQRLWYNFRGDERTQWMQNTISSQITEYVQDHDPALLALFAHVNCGTGAYVTALNSYFRAFAINPDDPALNLAIGIAYIQQAMKRQAENRQFQIQQGLAFMNRYHQLRTRSGVALHCSEAEFNVGRTWHALGVMNQAIAAYERCIALSERVKEERKDKYVYEDTGAEDFASEAAFGLQTIYAVSGDAKSALKVTEAVLVIE